MLRWTRLGTRPSTGADGLPAVGLSRAVDVEVCAVTVRPSLSGRVSVVKGLLPTEILRALGPRFACAKFGHVLLETVGAEMHEAG